MRKPTRPRTARLHSHHGISVIATACFALLAAADDVARSEPAPAARPSFLADGPRGFVFDTGVLRGRLHAEGKSLGLTEVVHVPSGTRMDHGYGLLSHYRVFTRGVRYGAGAWDWPSEAVLRGDGSVAIRFATEGRPFSLVAVYRVAAADTVEVETKVEAGTDVKGFETFLASYFDAAFTNAAVWVKGRDGARWAAALPEQGDWQMFVRDSAARGVVEDGRWRLEPHPVAWTFPFELAGEAARARRMASGRGVGASFSASLRECFAVAMPHQTESHYSVYFSLFGRDLKAGESATATVRLSFESGTGRE